MWKWFLCNTSSAGCCVCIYDLFVNDVTSLFPYTRAGQEPGVLRTFYNHLSPCITHMMDGRPRPWIRPTPGIHHFPRCFLTVNERNWWNEGISILKEWVIDTVYQTLGRCCRRPAVSPKSEEIDSWWVGTEDASLRWKGGMFYLMYRFECHLTCQIACVCSLTTSNWSVFFPVFEPAVWL